MSKMPFCSLGAHTAIGESGIQTDNWSIVQKMFGIPEEWQIPPGEVGEGFTEEVAFKQGFGD